VQGVVPEKLLSLFITIKAIIPTIFVPIPPNPKLIADLLSKHILMECSYNLTVYLPSPWISYSS
jgi:hypothetical protein